MFIIFYDGATNLATARAVETQTTDSIIAQMTEYFEVYQLTPTVVVGDQQFMKSSSKHIMLVMGSSPWVLVQTLHGPTVQKLLYV